MHKFVNDDQSIDVKGMARAKKKVENATEETCKRRSVKASKKVIKPKRFWKRRKEGT